MREVKKKRVVKTLKCRKSSTVVVIESSISAKDTLFPEKVAEAKKILRKVKFVDTRFGPK